MSYLVLLLYPGIMTALGGMSLDSHVSVTTITSNALSKTREDKSSKDGKIDLVTNVRSLQNAYRVRCIYHTIVACIAHNCLQRNFYVCMNSVPGILCSLRQYTSPKLKPTSVS